MDNLLSMIRRVRSAQTYIVAVEKEHANGCAILNTAPSFKPQAASEYRQKAVSLKPKAIQGVWF
jgi:hypothetical protein